MEIEKGNGSFFPYYNWIIKNIDKFKIHMTKQDDHCLVVNRAKLDSCWWDCIYWEFCVRKESQKWASERNACKLETISNMLNEMIYKLAR